MDSSCGAGGNNFKNNGKWRVNVIKPQAVQNSAPLNEYNERLAEVLQTRDVFRFRHFLASNGRSLPEEMMLDTLKMATLMHQMILSLPQLSALHDFSRQWLDDNTALTSQQPSLNEAAKRVPGVPEAQPGRRSISLRPLPGTQE